MSSFEEYFYKNIGSKIRVYRLAKGITQEQLSEMLCKNSKYIGHVERCERKISNKILTKLLDMWQIQPSEFFDFEELYNWKN